ncbi:cell division protein ZipA [Flocculibacter collagenilyticus]|uniref:cell division protein ZipA n=1 Tax=Flocculibacter collagenilyticus TaxID=2744479 RepID=UPI0018F47A97|nr:cell division protein ZipA [Flocculibacter collagenilyticus]
MNMAEELRLVLIIIGALAIGGLLVHGLWTVRKNNKASKLDNSTINAYESGDEKQSNDANAEGFDQYGVGKVKVVSKATRAPEMPASETPTIHTGEHSRQEPNFNHQAVEPNIANSASFELNVEPREQFIEPSLSVEQVDAPVSENEPYYSSQHMHQDTSQDASHNTAHTIITNNNADAFEDSKVETAPAFTEQAITEPVSTQEQSFSHDESSPNSNEEVEEELQAEEVLIIHVVTQDKMMPGASLLPTLLTLGFKYSDMGLFHRHQDNSGNGPVLFSLANMYNPGTFDIDTMEQVSTQGVSLFMTLPCAGDALQNFNMMHNAAKKLAEDYNAQMLDNSRSVLTVQTVRHYVEKIREFERKKLIAG